MKKSRKQWEEYEDYPDKVSYLEEIIKQRKPQESAEAMKIKRT